MRTLLCASIVLALAAAGSVPAGQSTGQDVQPPRHVERVTVSRVLVDTRVIDAHGQPVMGLQPSGFRVRIDGKPARVESAEWVGESGAAADPRLPDTGRPAAGGNRGPVDAVRGRLIVFLFQKDLEASRIVGLMRMLIDTRNFLDALGPGDRVAVLSFDTHLKIWLDFTASLDKVRRVMERGILFENPKSVEPVLPPALMTTLDVVRARRAYSMEQSLALLGRALEPLPGSKSVVLIGHGFGNLSGGSVYFEGAYAEARRALQAARASVFCLDTTDADAHTLEAGLEMTAADTGGFFERTHLFPARAMARLAGALAGHYVLFVEVTAPVKREWHDIEVDLVEKRGTVLAKRSYAEGQH